MVIHTPWRDVAPGDGPEISTSLLPEEANALAELANGKRVLELGACNGYSTIVMALGGAAHIDTVDIFATFDADRGKLESNLAAYGVADTVSIHEINTAEILGEFEENTFDLVFIDASHEYQSEKRDVVLSLHLLKPGGYLAAHDYDEDCNLEVRKALDSVFPEGPERIVGTLFITRKGE